MTTTADARQVAIAVIQRLPEGATLEDIVYALYFRQHVDEGLRQVREGGTIPHDEVVRMVAEWQKSAGAP